MLIGWEHVSYPNRVQKSEISAESWNKCNKSEIFTLIANQMRDPGWRIFFFVIAWYTYVASVKVPITPKIFFRLNKSLHLFETHCAILPLFNPNVDLLQAVKVTKSGHHLSHDRASKGYGSIPCLTSQTSLHACLQRLNTMQISLWHQTRNRPMPLTSSVVWQMMARFRNFYNVKKSQDLV